MHSFNQTMQRGREGGFFSGIGNLGVLTGVVLWAFLQLSLVTLYVPTTWQDTVQVALRIGVALLLGAGCALVLPALLAIIAPFTPAGQLLQEVRRTTWGFGVALAAALFLSYYAYQMISAYWAATLAPALVESAHSIVWQQTILTFVLIVVIPALAFSWSSPMAWLAEVQQAHQVKRLKQAHEAELAAMKAAYIKAADYLRIGLANLTMEQRQETASILIAMQRQQNDALHAIAGTFQTLADTEVAGLKMGLPTDGDLIGKYEQLARVLEGGVRTIEDAPAEALADDRDAPTYLASWPLPARASVPQQDAERTRPVASASAPVPVPQGPPGTATGRPGDREALAAARAGLSGAWTRSDLETCLSCAKTTASDLIRAWRAAGLVVELTDPRHHYRWTEAAR